MPLMVAKYRLFPGRPLIQEGERNQLPILASTANSVCTGELPVHHLEWKVLIAEIGGDEVDDIADALKQCERGKNLLPGHQFAVCAWYDVPNLMGILHDFAPLDHILSSELFANCVKGDQFLTVLQWQEILSLFIHLKPAVNGPFKIVV
ncbi:hypothetical protein ACHAQH_001227 [Verticillium albo-atrum]